MRKTKQLLRAIYKRLKRPIKRTLVIGQRIRLHEPKLFYLGGAWERANVVVYIEPYYILEYYKENEKYCKLKETERFHHISLFLAKDYTCRPVRNQ